MIWRGGGNWKWIGIPDKDNKIHNIPMEKNLRRVCDVKWLVPWLVMKNAYLKTSRPHTQDKKRANFGSLKRLKAKYLTKPSREKKWLSGEPLWNKEGHL